MNGYTRPKQHGVQTFFGGSMRDETTSTEKKPVNIEFPKNGDAKKTVKPLGSEA